MEREVFGIPNPSDVMQKYRNIAVFSSGKKHREFLESSVIAREIQLSWVCSGAVVEPCKINTLEDAWSRYSLKEDVANSRLSTSNGGDLLMSLNVRVNKPS